LGDFGLQVEDMLKRSFAEFHAQKKLPEMQQLLKRKLDQPRKAIEYVSNPSFQYCCFRL